MINPVSRAPGAPWSALVAAGLFALAVPAQAQQMDLGCGNPFVNGFGPHDYRVETGHNRKIVEDFHFTPQVESLIAGKSASVGADLDYTLRAFPNHHRALVAVMNLGARTRMPTPPGAQFSVDCYFKRALQFRPDDSVARMLYAKYLGTVDRKPDARRQLDFVIENAGDNAFTHYNAGLLFAEMGDMDRALIQAHKAMSLGFMRTELQQKLKAAGKWAEPPADAASAPPAAASAVRQ